MAIVLLPFRPTTHGLDDNAQGFRNVAQLMRNVDECQRQILSTMQNAEGQRTHHHQIALRDAGPTRTDCNAKSMCRLRPRMPKKVTSRPANNTQAIRRRPCQYALHKTTAPIKFMPRRNDLACQTTINRARAPAEEIRIACGPEKCCEK